MNIKSLRAYPNLAVVAFVSMLLPSTILFNKYFGARAVLLYYAVAFVILTLIVGFKDRLLRFLERLPDKAITLLIVILFITVLAVTAIMYPIANSGRFGPGSDSDDSINVAANELLHGRYPYYPILYTGQPISQLPGALMLALPFVAVFGHAAYQNVVWLIVFFLVIRKYLKLGNRSAFLLLASTFLLAPTLIYHFMIGPDYITNSLVVLIASTWMVETIPDEQRPWWQHAGPAVLLGIGLSARLSFLFVTPLLFAILVRKAGWQRAVLWCSVTALTFLVVTLPFYLADPAGFTPLWVQQKFTRYEDVLPAAGVIVPAITALVSVGLALSQTGELKTFYRGCMWLLSLPLILSMLLQSIQLSAIAIQFTVYGIFATLYGAAAIWLELDGKG